MTSRRLLGRNKNGEQGAVLIFAAVGMVVMILAAAMAIDVGSVIWRKRDLQVVVDVAATDTAQQLGTVVGGPTQAAAKLFAEESANRNAFAFAAPNSLQVLLGTLNPATRNFVVTAPASATAVQVVATRKVPFNFAPGSNTVTTKAVASFDTEARAAFSIGSKLASLDARSSNVLGPVLSGLLGVNPSLTAGVVTYQGLASSRVTYGALATELGLATVDDLLLSNVTVPQLATASAQILNRQGTSNTDIVAPLLAIAARSSSSLNANFGDLVDVEQGQGDAVASMGINVLDLLTSAGQRARIIDGANVLNIPLNVNIVGLASSSLKLKLIEAPVISAFGPVGTQAKTGQVETTLTTRIEVGTPSICVLFICIPRIAVVELPIVLGAAGATGTISAIGCSVAPPQTPVDISVATQGVTATARTTAQLLGIVGLDVVNAEFPIAPGTTTPPLRFPKPPRDPVPMVFPSAIQSTTGTQTLATGLVEDARLTVLGLTADGLLALLRPVTTQIDNVILNPLLDALGLSVGGADVRTLGVECPGGAGRLVQ